MRRLCLNRSGVFSGMIVENLLQWLISATQDESLDATNWQMVVAIAQAAFHDGTLDKECTW